MTSKEFDNLLRRVPAKVTVDCDGFDPDLATAYLEKRLNSKEQASYQLHLSACTPCRRMITRLAELSEPIPPKISPFKYLLETLTAWLTSPQLRYALPVIAVALTVSVWFAFQTPKTETLVKDKPLNLPAQPLAPTETRIFPQPPSDNKPEIESRGKSRDGAGGQVVKGRKAKEEVASEDKSVEADSLAIAGSETVQEGSNEKQLGGKEAGEREEQASKTAGIQDTKEMFPQEIPKSSIEARRDSAAVSKQPAVLARPAPNAKDESKPDNRAKKVANEGRQTVRVSSKIFHLKDGVWVDEEYDDSQRLRIVRIRKDEQGYIDAVKNSPKLVEYFNLGSRVIVVLDGVVYDYTGK